MYANNRSEDRVLDRIEDTTIVLRRRKMKAREINVSSRRAMIEIENDNNISEKIDILFDAKNKTKCVVRWIRENRIGLEFLSETILWDAGDSGNPVFQYEDQSAASGPRAVADREPRQTLLRSGTLYWSGISIAVRLRNISSNGAQIEGGHTLRPGCEVELDLGEAGFHYAEVRWAKDGQLGLRFATDFDIERLAPSDAGATRSPASDMLKPAYLETETRADSPWAARFERLTLDNLKDEGKF